MEHLTFFWAYLLTFLTCLVLTAAIIILLNKGLKKFFSQISPDPEISGFFTKITTMVLFLAGISAGIAANFDTGEKANWLTMTWDASKQIKESLQQVFITLLILAISFFLLLVLDRKVNK
jgi:hypothetical protein